MNNSKPIKVIIFDLDGTLAPFNRPSELNVIHMLRTLENRGILIGICSGKPLSYLCGYMRQIGLREPVILGENGSDIQFGVVFPPSKCLRLPCPGGSLDKLETLRKTITQALPGVWFQPNNIVLTPFFAGEEERSQLRSIIYREIHPDDGIVIYEHPDCFDLVPFGINKSEGIKALSHMLDIPAENFAAVGDGVNDTPMFEFAGLSVGINLQDSSIVDSNVNTIEEALELLLNLTADNVQQ